MDFRDDFRDDFFPIELGPRSLSLTTDGVAQMNREGSPLNFTPTILPLTKEHQHTIENWTDLKTLREIYKDQMWCDVTDVAEARH